MLLSLQRGSYYEATDFLLVSLHSVRFKVHYALQQNNRERKSMSEIILAGETALKCYKSLRVQEYPLTQAILRKNVKVPTVDELENIKYE